MIDRIKGRIAFICDECQDGLETDDYEFDAALKTMNEMGWKNYHVDKYPYNPPKVKVGTKYINLCKHCFENA